MKRMAWEDKRKVKYEYGDEKKSSLKGIES